MRLYGIVGAGGFGREVLPVAESMLKAADPMQDFEVVFVVEYGQAQSINGHRVLLLDEFLASDREKYFNITIADAVVRGRIAEQMISHGVAPFSIQALNSMSLSSNQIGEGAILCPFTLVTANAIIGRFFHANIYSYVAHDCQIGDFVTFAPSVHCNGHVIVEDYAYIGTGAILKQGSAENPLIIGRGAIVGMGAVVTKSVAPYTTVVGNPAKPLVKP